MTMPWWINTNRVPKVLDKQFLAAYGKLHDAGLDPTSASVLASEIVHHGGANVANYLRRNAVEKLADLGYRATLELQSGEYHRYPKESSQG